MKFLVVIPTVRQALPGFEDVMEEVRSSFTQPTDFHVLDGKAGKAQTLNQVLDELLPQSDCDVFVTMDDDYIPAPGWQETIEGGMAALPKVGAFGLWLGEGEEMQAYMRASDYVLPRRDVKGLTVRMVRIGYNIPGAFLAFRKATALAIGPTPVGEERYQIYEDGYRCGRVQKMGLGLAYLDVDPPPRMLHYPDPAEYHANKTKDIESAIANMETYTANSQPRQPLLVSARRFVGHVKRRIFRPRA